MKLFRPTVPMTFEAEEEEAPVPEGRTMITLQNTFGRPYRWTDLGVQEVALRIKTSESIPLTEGDWLSPWNIDTYMSKEKWDTGIFFRGEPR